MSEEFKKYVNIRNIEARPYIPYENLSNITVHFNDTRKGHPKKGDMIARNIDNNQWLIPKEYFEKHFIEQSGNNMNIKISLTSVKIMHEKFGISCDKVPFSQEEKNFRISCLKEEIQEYEEASTPQDELDAIVDLMVFAVGTLERHGFLDIFEEAFNRVMEANMQKQLGGNAKRGSFALDLVKPEGWVAPNFDDLFEVKE